MNLDTIMAPFPPYVEYTSKSSQLVRMAERRRGFRRTADLERSVVAALGQWFLEREHQPHFILHGRSRAVVLMNAAAHEVLPVARAIRIRGGQFEFIAKAHSAELARVLAGEADSSSLEIRVGALLETLTIRAVRFGHDLDSCLLIKITGDQGLAPRIRAELGLTAAESEIALSIYRGLSLDQVASERGASINTVKTQLRYVFHKVGVRSKVALTRRIGEMR